MVSWNWKKDGRVEQCMTVTSVGARLQKTKEHVLAEWGLGPLGGSRTTTPTSTCSNHRYCPLCGASTLLLALLMLLGGGQCGLWYSQLGAANMMALPGVLAGLPEPRASGIAAWSSRSPGPDMLHSLVVTLTLSGSRMSKKSASFSGLSLL